MEEMAIVFSPKYYEHNTGRDHPESSRRLKTVMRELKRLNLFSATSGCQLVEPELASIENLELVHDPEYVGLVKRICELGGGLLDLGDTVVSPKSFEVARYAVGGARTAVDSVLDGNYQKAFALVRPPGHHAGPYYGAGFCVFNNVAVAAAYLIEQHSFERVLILDVDAHHGNGTQEIFYDSEKALYMSLHEDPREFPGTGFVDEVGEGAGLGYNVNVPLPFGTGDEEYMKAFDEVVVPVARQYEPQFVLVSVGYDSHYGDPVGKLQLSAAAYESIFKKTLDLASTVCQGRLVAVLEGGYNLGQLGKLAALTISRMADFSYSMKDGTPPANSNVARRARRVIEKVEKAHSAFWKLRA